MISESDKSRLQVGLKQVTKALDEDKASKVFLADDCDSSICHKVEALCALSGATLNKVGSMRELGTMCGIEVKASCAVILK